MKRLAPILSSLTAWVFQPLLVLAILIVGFVAASRLSLKREPPQRSGAAVYSPLVRTLVTELGTYPVEVRGTGSLEARSRIILTAQVGGEVLEIHHGLRDGGRFRAGEILLRIEPRDYELAVARAEAEIAFARTEITTLEAESEAAIEEWDQLNPGEPCPALVRLEPQLNAARARVQSSTVELERARLDLQRTGLSLPFDGRVVEASIDVGEVLAPRQSLGVVYATDVYEVAVPLRVEELVWIHVPEGPDDVSGSHAIVRGAGAGGPLEIPGRVVRMYGELGATSRLAQVVVEIRAADLTPELASDLLPGTFVDVTLNGANLEQVASIPRGALREDGVVWVVEEGTLRYVRPTIRHRGSGSLLVEGLAPGARVVTSSLEVVTDGMQVRLEEAPEQ